MPRKIIAGTIFLATALAGLQATAQGADVGKQIYDQYCATCHGVSGKGDGPLTELMTDKVADLTQLAKNNDGVFPMLNVIHIIDGRTGLRGHGGPMPTYGDIFMSEAATGTAMDISNVLVTRGRILSVATYLESLQE